MPATGFRATVVALIGFGCPAVRQRRNERWGYPNAMLAAPSDPLLTSHPLSDFLFPPLSAATRPTSTVGMLSAHAESAAKRKCHDIYLACYMPQKRILCHFGCVGYCPQEPRVARTSLPSGYCAPVNENRGSRDVAWREPRLVRRRSLPMLRDPGLSVCGYPGMPGGVQGLPRPGIFYPNDV